MRPQPFPAELLAQIREIYHWHPGGDPLAEEVGRCWLVDSTPQASDRMAAFRDDCYTRTREPDEVASAIWARCGEKAHKLSLIYACSKHLAGHIRHGHPLLIDLETAEWDVMATESSPTSRTGWLFAAGGGLTIFGAFLRFSARALAWPSSYSFSGDRANTQWAFTERAYVDVSFFAIGFGLAMLLLAVWLVYRNATPVRSSP